ncbi:MAG: zinc ribbon domain-containing protein [Gammaproteobacteria bacterium]|nr:zinc ribbon domain-containing protein [Gammaproteobacteria bacterium]
MPTYEYRCNKCDKQFVRIEHLSEHGSKAASCPKCKSKRVVRVLGSFFANTSKKS